MGDDGIEVIKKHKYQQCLDRSQGQSLIEDQSRQDQTHAEGIRNTEGMVAGVNIGKAQDTDCGHDQKKRGRKVRR